jgi:hypothetical protein
MSLESDGGMILTGKNRRTRRKTCPSATLSATNPTWIDPGANPGLRGERPATNDLSHGTVHSSYLLQMSLLVGLPASSGRQVKRFPSRHHHNRFSTHIYPRDKYALSKVRRCLRHNLCSQPYGSKSLVRSTGSAVLNF